jgi:hypothetical protein
MPVSQDNPEDMQTIDSCEYIWEAGVGFAYSQPINVVYDQHRWRDTQTASHLLLRDDVPAPCRLV